ncbi:hypothetical protein BDV96DRAFT_607303 [Lophiotrema nucula]|uniref:Uncharacterized protein n=1 Tax=Lophiotrema nucula TaxID=690887 RepID=A0A6A5YHS2_9PLEO|nr:hypothetical protein BDV96DRAFT_607303 [Lophiotrema nucula]
MTDVQSSKQPSIPPTAYLSSIENQLMMKYPYWFKESKPRLAASKASFYNEEGTHVSDAFLAGYQDAPNKIKAICKELDSVRDSLTDQFKDVRYFIGLLKDGYGEHAYMQRYMHHDIIYTHIQWMQDDVNELLEKHRWMVEEPIEAIAASPNNLMNRKCQIMILHSRDLFTLS